MARTELPSVVFADNSYLVALANARDQWHARAQELYRDMHVARTRLVTTRAVLLEFGNQMSKRDRRGVAVRFLQALEQDSLTEIVEVTPDLYAAGFALFAGRPDKDWGLVDCLSFALMTARGLTDALTADDHFTQAGFAALLLA